MHWREAFCGHHQRHRPSKRRRRVRRQLHAGPASRARFRVCRDRAADRSGEADRRNLLWPARGTFLLCRLFHGRQRSHVDVPALPAVFRWHLTQLRRRMRTGARVPLSDSDKKAVIAKLLEVCDARDGVADGMIFDVARCNFRPGDLQCRGCQGGGMSLAGAGGGHREGLCRPEGFTRQTGIPGLLLRHRNRGAGRRHSGSSESGAESGGRSGCGGDAGCGCRDRCGGQQSCLARWRQLCWANLNTFSSHGGKLIFYHGVSDPWFSAKDTIDYYQRVAAASGGEAKLKDWSRLFLSPGMGHCGGGSATLDTFDMLSASVAWVEKGQAPQSVIATGRAFPDSIPRPQPSAYPAHAQYKGQGSVEDAANFACRQ